MADGAATWETAGLFELDGSNTFDLSTTTAGAARPYFRAYWVYYSLAAGLFSLDATSSPAGDPSLAHTIVTVYQGDETTPVVVESSDFSVSFYTDPGVRYTFMVGTYDDDGDTITQYDLTGSFTAFPPGPQTLVLHPGAPFVEENSPDNSPMLVGTGPIWSDNDDSTYAIEYDITSYSRAHYDKWSGIAQRWITAIGATARMMPGGGGHASVYIQLDAEVSRLLAVTANNIGIIGSTFADFSHVFQPSEYSTTGWAPEGMQSALNEDSMYLRIIPSDGTDSPDPVMIAEQSIVIYYTVPDPISEFPTYQRVYPRDDGLATGAPRNYPDSRSRQHGHRLAGGYL